MQVTFWPLGWKETLEKERLPTPVFWPGKFHGLYSPWRHKESNTTERLSLTPLTPVILTHPNIWEPQFSTLNSPSLPTEHPFLTFPEKKQNKNPEVNEPPTAGIATFPCPTLSIHSHIVRTEMILSFSTSNPQESPVSLKHVPVTHVCGPLCLYPSRSQHSFFFF